MNKKQILATCLAGVLTLGCISGCSNKVTNYINKTVEISEIPSEDIISDYISVEKILAPTIETKEGCNYYLPSYMEESGWIIEGDTLYSLIHTIEYNAIKDKDGNYYLQYGGTLLGHKGILKERIADKDMLEDYIKGNSYKLTK